MFEERGTGSLPGRGLSMVNGFRNSRSSKGHWQPFLFALGLLLLWASAGKAQEARIRLAVVGLDNPSTLYKSNIGNSLVDQLDSQISAVGKYTLLERSALQELKQELNLGQSGFANAKSFAQKGGLAGADFLLLGKVSDYTYKENASQSTQYVPGVGFQAVVVYDHIAHVRIDIRVVDVTTGEDVRSVSGEGGADAKGVASYQAQWNYYVQSEGQRTFADLQTLLTQASHEAIQHVVSELDDMEPDLESFLVHRTVTSQVASVGEGKILADLGQGQFVIGVPSTAGLKVGDRFQVIAEVPLKNAQGVVVYEEKRTVGTLQVTNISENSRALASLVQPSGAASTGPGPTEGDTLAFDQSYGKSLRGVTVSTSGASPGGPGGGTATAEITRYLRRGDRFMDEQNYSEALDQYNEALRLQASSGEALGKKSEAEMAMGDLNDAEDDAEKAIGAGGSVSFPAYHIHAFGHCEGTLVIERGKASYQPTAGSDSFTATSKGQIAVLQADFPAQGARIPILVIHATGQGDKERKYEMIFPMFLTHPSPALAINFQVTADGASQTKRLDGIIVRLINASLQ